VKQQLAHFSLYRIVNEMQNERRNLFQHAILIEFKKAKVNFLIITDNTEGNSQNIF